MLSPPVRVVWRPSLLPWWLVPALLPWGRSAELGTLLCLLGLIVLWRRQPPPPAPAIRCWLALIGAYVLAALISVPAALHPAKAAWTTLGLLRLVPLGLYACWVIRDAGRLYAVYALTGWLVLGWCLDAWLQIATGWSLGGPAQVDRITGIFGAANLKLGPVLAVLSPFLLWLGQRYGGGRGLLLAWWLVSGPVMLSGARSAWIALALVGLVFGWRAAGNRRNRLLILASASALAMLLAAVSWQCSPRFHARAERSLHLLDGSRQGLDTALTGRLAIWGTAGRMIMAHPWTGVGVREFREAYPAYALPGDRFLDVERCGPGQGACHPHQWVLEVLAETGLLGGCCWLAGMALLWRRWRRLSPWQRELMFPASAALLALGFPFNTHLAFYSAWWGLLACWLLALWCAGVQIRPEGVADERS